MRRFVLRGSVQLRLALVILMLVDRVFRFLQTSCGFTGETSASTRPRRIQAQASQESFLSSVKTGTLVQLDGEPHLVQEVFSGEASGPARAKLKNIHSGKVIYKTWKKGTTLVHVVKESRPAMFSYLDEESRPPTYVFYDENFAELRVGSDILGDDIKWLVDGAQVDLKLFDGRVIEFGFRGDVLLTVIDIVIHNRVGNPSAARKEQDQVKSRKNSKGSKRVLLSNGEVVTGPKYIQIGDRVVVDPHTHAILKRQ